MPHLRTTTSKPAFAALPILLALSIGLTACGGSSSSTATQAAANVATTPTIATTTSPGASTTSPGESTTGTSSTPSTGASPTGTASTSAPPAPAGTSSTGTAPAGTATTGTAARPSAHIPPLYTTPRAHQAFARFAVCMRKNGIDLPEPNTTGKGPLFDTKGIDTASPQFKAAAKKCRFALFGTAKPNSKTSTGGAGA
jgi:hypothetical protein